MKTFTYKQAIEVLNKYFKGYKVLRKFDGIRELSILFRDERLINYAISLGLNNGFIQEGETAKESFIPEFDGEGV